MNEQELIKKRFDELSDRAYHKGYPTYSGFLNQNEISLLKSRHYKCNYKLYGGYEHAERCMVCFSEYAVDCFPIACIKAEPVQLKFADKLGHRDFLGAIMNSGIERSTIGDIKIKDNVGYIFCTDTISDYIIDSLNRIRHTSIKCTKIDNLPDFINELPDEENIIVSSLRVDVITAGIYKLSRNAVTQLVNQDKLFINSIAVTKDGIQLKENDIVSVRGYGKFIFSGISGSTKKGRIIIKVRIFK